MTKLPPGPVPGPLDGTRILDAGNMIAGPYGATLLGDLGADIIKVEPTYGDDLRRLGPQIKGETGSFIGVNRSKRGIALDLAHPAGQEVFARLAGTADALITNTREPALSRLGLSYDQVRRHRPDIIWVGVSTFGADGPYAGRPGVDALAQALCGVTAFNGEPGRPPVRLNVPIADIMASLLVVSGVLTALYERTKSGQGQRIDVSLVDAVVHALCNALGQYFTSGWVVPRSGNRSPYFAPSGMYECADGARVFLTCPTEKFFQNLCQALETDWADDPRFRTIELRLQHEDDLDAQIAQRCRRFVQGDLMGRLVAADVMAAPVNELPEVVREPQVRHNRMIVTTQHETLGGLDVTGVPLHLQRTPGRVRRSPPVLGQHTAEVLAELGYRPDQIAEMERSGAVVSHEARK